MGRGREWKLESKPKELQAVRQQQGGGGGGGGGGSLFLSFGSASPPLPDWVRARAPAAIDLRLCCA